MHGDIMGAEKVERINYTIRPITAADEAFLWQIIYYAAHMHEEADKTVADAMQNATLALYVTAWGRPGDLGFVAEAQPTGVPVGAGWVRLYTGDNKAYSPTDDVTPELAIAVLPAHLNQGIGTALLQALIAAAQPHFSAIALNVRAENPALRLYQRLGFVRINEIPNRVGGISYDMRLRFT